MDALVAFIRARLDKNEQSAKAMTHAIGGIQSLWSPAQLLADVDAKRRIVDAYEKAHATMPDWGEEDYPGGWRDGLEHAVRLLASGWSTHPDYRQEWDAAHPDSKEG